MGAEILQEKIAMLSEILAAFDAPASIGPADTYQDIVTDADRMTRAVQALLAVLSQRPHSHAVRKNPDAYLQFAASVERAGNAIRDAFDERKRPDADKPDILDMIRTAFDGNDIAYKNRALRKAHDEIQRLRS